MKITQLYLLLLLPLVVGGLEGCVGAQSFTTAARAGETVALTVGYQKDLKRQNLTVTITDSSGAKVTYLPNDTKVRGVVNMYPDPVSKVVIGTQTSQALGVNANGLGGNINYVTGSDPDWCQTSLLLDLPTLMQTPVNNQSIATGIATIAITDSAGAVIYPIKVEILSGTSTANAWSVYLSATATQNKPNAIKMLERADNYTVTFTGASVPYSMQVILAHSPDVDHGGVGRVQVVNPPGDMKSVSWADDGSTTKIMLKPSKETQPTNMKDFKFYIAGGIMGLTSTPIVKAYDINGSPITGVTATVKDSTL